MISAQIMQQLPTYGHLPANMKKIKSKIIYSGSADDKYSDHVNSIKKFAAD